MPVRIQRRRTKGWQMPANTVSVTRPSVFGNPFTEGGPEQRVVMYREWLRGSGRMDRPLQKLLYNLPALRGKDLACFCPLGQVCHADVLLELANREGTPQAVLTYLQEAMLSRLAVRTKEQGLLLPGMGDQVWYAAVDVVGPWPAPRLRALVRRGLVCCRRARPGANLRYQVTEAGRRELELRVALKEGGG